MWGFHIWGYESPWSTLSKNEQTTSKCWVSWEMYSEPKYKSSSWMGHHRSSGSCRQLDISIKNPLLPNTNQKTQNCEYSFVEYSQFWVFLFIFGRSGFLTIRSNCLQLPELLWCPIQELDLYFGSEYISHDTQHFEVVCSFLESLDQGDSYPQIWNPHI